MPGTKMPNSDKRRRLRSNGRDEDANNRMASAGHLDGLDLKPDPQSGTELLTPSEPEVPESQPQIPDGEFGWVIVAATCYISMVCVGTIMCYGVVYVEFLTYFEAGRTKTSFIGSLSTLAGAFAGPIAGTLSVRFGHRPVVMIGCLLGTIGMATSAFAVNIYYLYFSFGFLTGCGVGMSMIPSLGMVAVYFDKKLSLASALALTGGGLSYIIFPIVSEACIRFYTWRGTMFILAAMWFQACVGAALLRPLPKLKQCAKEVTSSHSSRDLDLLKTWQFWFYMLEEFLWHIEFMNFVVILPDFAILSGHTQERAAILMTIIGVFLIPARLLGGYIFDTIKISPILLLTACILILGTLSLVLPFTRTVYVGMGIVCGIRGIMHGVIVVLLPRGLLVLFGRDKLTVMIGYSTFAVCFGQLTAPPLGGFIYDKTGDYLYAYITCCLISYVTATIPLALYFDVRRRENKQKNVEEEEKGLQALGDKARAQDGRDVES